MVNKPKLNDLWKHFPDHDTFPTLEDLYTWLGGQAERNIDAPGFGPGGNTCASRMSVALNKSGAPIDMGLAKAAGAATIGTGDGSRIIFRVRELRAYLLKAFGTPSVDVDLPYGDRFDGKRGIIAFTVNWADASGHIALFDQGNFREPGHDDYTTYVKGTSHTSKAEFWELP